MKEKEGASLRTTLKRTDLIPSFQRTGIRNLSTNYSPFRYTYHPPSLLLFVFLMLLMYIFYFVNYYNRVLTESSIITKIDCLMPSWTSFLILVWTKRSCEPIVWIQSPSPLSPLPSPRPPLPALLPLVKIASRADPLIYLSNLLLYTL